MLFKLYIYKLNSECVPTLTLNYNIIIANNK